MTSSRGGAAVVGYRDRGAKNSNNPRPTPGMVDKPAPARPVPVIFQHHPPQPTAPAASGTVRGWADLHGPGGDHPPTPLTVAPRSRGLRGPRGRPSTASPPALTPPRPLLKPPLYGPRPPPGAHVRWAPPPHLTPGAPGRLGVTTLALWFRPHIGRSRCRWHGGALEPSVPARTDQQSTGAAWARLRCRAAAGRPTVFPVRRPAGAPEAAGPFPRLLTYPCFRERPKAERDKPTPRGPRNPVASLGQPLGSSPGAGLGEPPPGKPSLLFGSYPGRCFFRPRPCTSSFHRASWPTGNIGDAPSADPSSCSTASQLADGSEMPPTRCQRNRRPAPDTAEPPLRPRRLTRS